MPPERAAAFAPGRVNLIGEHTDYNDGLALAFAIADGVTVRAQRNDERSISAIAHDIGKRDAFGLQERKRARGWRAFVRGAVAELQDAGYPLVGACLDISGSVPRGSGLSSSAALEVALCLALLELGGTRLEEVDRVGLARICARIECEWAGAQTGLLDQLASLFGEPDTALLIDFATLHVDQVPLALDGWRVVVLDSGERHVHASSGYNERRAECRCACEILGVRSLREVRELDLERLPDPLRARARHVLSENERVLEAAGALRAGELARVGVLLDASHASLRDDYEVSTGAVERAVRELRDAGAAGARLMGGGFGGSALGLFAPGREPPAGAREVRPAAGAHLLD